VSDDDAASSPKKKADAGKSPETKHPRPHDLDRTSSWRDSRDDEGKNDEKKFLTPKEKKKIAFINHDFHSNADTVNAYVVFGHPPPPKSRPSNLPPLPPVMDPYEAARLAATKCDGMLFMERMIRVDVVRKAEHRDVDGDPKLSVFVGNIDFESKEEDLRVFFEAAVSSERGPRGDGSDGKSSWVTRVRIVRDKDTQLGKGFAYVQFAVRFLVC
jgi:nucleolar protein 12